MATNVRSHARPRARSISGQSSFFSSGSGSNWGVGRTSAKQGNIRKTNKIGTTAKVPAGYKACNNAFVNKISSYKTLYKQTFGPAKFSRPSPTTLNSFANWINKGAVVQMVTKAQVSRWAKATKKGFNVRSATPTTCKNVLCAKFGKTTIKAVCGSKSGSFMVATSPTVSGRPFWFPTK